MASASVLARRWSSRARASSWTGGLTLSGSLSLLSVVAVLVVVSVPRLRGLALQENEDDARTTAQSLALALSDISGDGGVPSVGELLLEAELAALTDAELLSGGRLLRRHGYLFEVTRLSAPLTLPGALAAFVRGGSARLDLAAIRAWPWAHGRTGVAAFLVAPDGTSLEHANVPPLWQGPSAAGAAVLDPSGWHAP